MKRTGVVLLIILLFVTACQSEQPTPAPTETAAPPIDTPTAVPTSTPTPRPTATPSPLPTSTPAPTEPPTPTLTLTPTPIDLWVTAVNGLNLRSDASATAALLKVLPFDAHLIGISSKTAPDAQGIAWQNVKTDDGQPGWVSAEFVTTTKPAGTATPTPTPIVSGTPSTPTPTPIAATPAVTSTGDVWATDILNLRAQPSKTANMLTTIAVNQHFTAIGSKSAPDADGLSWQNVKTDDGLIGYVAAQYLTTTKPVTPTPVTPTPVTPTPSSGSFTTDTAIAAELLRRTNELRAQNGLPSYISNADLNVLALKQAQYMASTHQFTHTGADGTTARQRITLAGYGAGHATENGYMGTFEQAWLFFSTDQSHLNNLLDHTNNVVGIGVVVSEGVTYITMDFGKPETGD